MYTMRLQAAGLLGPEPEDVARAFKERGGPADDQFDKKQVGD